MGWLKHYAYKIMYVGCLISLGLLPFAWLIPQLEPLFYFPLGMFLAGQLAGALHAMPRQGTWCERCALDYPRNGPALAMKHLRSLAMMHSGKYMLFHALFIILGLVAVFVWHSEPAAAAIYGVSAFDWRARAIHQRLIPWCPWCRRNNGNDDDHEQVPDPDPSMTKETT